MAHPIIIQESTYRNYLANFREVIRPAQWMYFETVLMGLIHCQASRTLSGMLRAVASLVMVWDLSRFLISPRWSTARLAEVRYQILLCEDTAPGYSWRMQRSARTGRENEVAQRQPW